MSDLSSRRICTTLLCLFPLTAVTLLSGCAAGNLTNASTSSASIAGPAFVIGTDAPLASVTSFSVQVQGISAISSSGASVALISGSPTVDFARYNGLQTLLDMNDVPVGTYTGVVITLGPANIGYLDTSGGTPKIQSEAATLTTSSVNITLASPLIVSQSAPVGLHVDFDLRKSIQLDSKGQITGQVTPTFKVNVVGPADADAYIDQLDGSVIAVNPASQSFVIQGPHGRQFTVKIDGNTEWDNNESITSLTTGSIVSVSGTLDRADSTLDADEVGVVSQSSFYADGQITSVTPATGAASSFGLYTRAVLPSNTGISLGQIAQVNLSGQEKFFMYRMHNPLTQFLFNQSGLTPGQVVAIGGPATGAVNGQAVTVNRVALRPWGFNGTIVPGSINLANNTFQMQVNGFSGLLIPQNVTVYVAGNTAFRKGLSSMSSVTGSANVRAVGLLLKDPASGQPILLAHYVDALN